MKTFSSLVFSVILLSQTSFAGATDIGSATAGSTKRSAISAQQNPAHSIVYSAFEATTDARPFRLLRCVVEAPVDTRSWLAEVNRQAPCANISGADIEQIINSSYTYEKTGTGFLKFTTKRLSADCLKSSELVSLVAKRCGLPVPW